MKSENTDKIREKILKLIESEFESDAAFERVMKIPDKTVNNWRRGRSSSFMTFLPELADIFRVNINEILDIPLRKDTSELSEDELHFLCLYRKSRLLPEKMRHALRETLESTVSLYINSYDEIKRSNRKSKKK